MMLQIISCLLLSEKIKENTTMMIPSEPNMLLSFINLKLRDNYSSLQDMCDDLDIDYTELAATLAASKITYDPGQNQLKFK